MARKVNRTEINFLLDLLLLVVFVALCICSAILEFVFPAGTQADGWRLWGRSFNDWSRFRFLLLATMALGVLVHVMLHWSWVCGVLNSRIGRRSKHRVTAHDDPSRTLWGVSLLIFIVNLGGAIIAAAALTIQEPVASPGMSFGVKPIASPNQEAFRAEVGIKSTSVCDEQIIL